LRILTTQVRDKGGDGKGERGGGGKKEEKEERLGG